MVGQWETPFLVFGGTKAQCQTATHSHAVPRTCESNEHGADCLSSGHCHLAVLSCRLDRHSKHAMHRGLDRRIGLD